MDTTLETFSIKLGNRWTTIRVERELMAALQEIAQACGVTVNDLATEAALDRTEGSFISALRVFIVSYYRGSAQDGGRAPHGRAGDYIVRTPMTVGDRGAAPGLEALHRWWEQARPAWRRMPRHEAIDLQVIKRLGLGGLVHVVDARADDPLDFRFRLWGRRVRARGALDLSGMRLGDVPIAEYRSAVAADYAAVATMATPRLQRVDAQIDERRRVYQRLVMPLSERAGKPTALLVAVSYEQAGGAEAA
jgi:predicted DNA-binding ribbon-helix-helix protein